MSQQTSRKTGVKSSAQKEDNTRHGTQPMPATQHQPGAFGKEPNGDAGENSPLDNKEPALNQRADYLDDESGETNAQTAGR